MKRPTPARLVLSVLMLAAALTACEEGIPPPLPESEVQLMADPTTVPSVGDTVALSATVTDEGAPVSGRTVTFTASPSTFGSPNPTTATTSITGVATSSLLLVNPAGQVTVTASAGDLGSDSVTITVQ